MREGFWSREASPHSISVYKSASSLLGHKQFDPEILPKTVLEVLLFDLDEGLLCFATMKKGIINGLFNLPELFR